jgi:hypothetical protein
VAVAGKAYASPISREGTGMPFDNSAKVVSFIQSYEKIWKEHFPQCFRRAHWNIVAVLRWKEQGVLFSEIRGHMDFLFGMDEDTCAVRLLDLILSGLATCDSEKIHSSTLITRTELLIDKYDLHAADAAHALVSASTDLGLNVPEGTTFAAGHSLSKDFSAFLKKFREELEENLNCFLENVITSPARRVKAMRQMRSYAYRHILLKSWTCYYEENTGGRCYLLIDDLHEDIYKALGLSSQTTTSYVRDMIQWGLLERLGRNNGVPRGRFAVRMARPAFDHLAAGFAAAAPHICEAAHSLLTARRDQAASVLVFPRAG